MNIFRNAILTSLLLLAFAISPARATIIDVADSGGYGYFMDTDTGYTWLDMDNFFGMSYNQMVTVATSLGFTVATSTEVSQLLGSLPLTGGEWSSYSSVMGSAPSRNLIWGAYDIGSTTTHGWQYAYDYDTSWHYGSGSNDVIYNVGTVHADLNIWAYSTSFSASVPETTSLLLMALGLIGLGVSVRKKVA